MYFIFDLDGAVYFKGEQMSGEMREAIQQLAEAEHEVIFTSAKSIRDMMSLIPQQFHHYTMIGGNGTLIAANGSVVHSQPFSADQMKEIAQFIKTYEATYLIDGDWDYDYTGPDDHPIAQQIDPANIAEMVPFDDLPSVVKVLILSSKDDDQFVEKLKETNVYVRKNDDRALDIRPKGVHKRTALENLGVEKDNYVAFGSDGNDLSLFDHAHHSVIIGNHGELAAIAKEVIQNVEDVEQRIIGKIKELSERYAF